MKRACVIGWPISHSLSPAIHGYWLEQSGIDAEYVKVAVEPKDLACFLMNLAANRYCGGNITVPHKIEAYRLCEHRDAAADAIGAVNTVWLESGRLAGSNTDAYGLLANLDREAAGWDRAGPAVVIGAGGAARAIVWALRQRGFEDIRIVNRTKPRAEELASAFPPASPHGLEALSQVLQGANLIINTSTLGMKGAPPLDIGLSGAALDATVCDIVYSPLETDLLSQARNRGLRAVDGLGMLLHQAVPGFEIWFGVRPDVTHDLRKSVLAAIQAREKAQT
jgi:shikimate dehydrogenase